MAQPSPARLSPGQARRLAAAPVGRLSTSSSSGQPHVIPVCFALGQADRGPVIYIVLDQKPKRTALTRLRRVRNILENPRVALLVDHYEEDWTQLWYLLITGTAQLLHEERASTNPEPVEGSSTGGPAHPEPVEGSSTGDPAHPEPVEGSSTGGPAHPEPVEGPPAFEEITHAVRLLREKYPQYRSMDIDGNPVIKITPRRVVSWSHSD